PASTPDDLVLPIDPVDRLLTPTGRGDLNFTRIINGRAFNSGQTQFTLPANLELTAGQTYYWAVVATQAGHDPQVETSTFTLAASAASSSNLFSSVTLLTHGWSFPFEDQIGLDYLEMAKYIAKQGGDGTVLTYRPDSGQFLP